MLKSLFLVLTIFFTICTYSQEINYNLDYEEFGVFFRPKKCNDTLMIPLKGKYQGSKLRLILNDCRGQAHFELYNRKGKLQVSGNYDNAVDTLKKHIFGKYLAQPEGTNKYSISTIKYLYPLKVGEWTYYEKNQTITYRYDIEL